MNRWLCRLFLAGSASALLVLPCDPSAAREPTLEKALEAPALELAQSYVFTQMVLSTSIPMAEIGATVYLGNEKITERNAAKKRKQYQNRLEIYAEAALTRGSVALAGPYQGKSSEACARVGSSWLELAGSDDVASITISQDGIEIVLSLSAPGEDETLVFDVGGAAVESSVVFMDPMNSDYYIHGAVIDGRVELRPSVEVLKGWPGWATPPKRADLENCLVELLPL
jgi:hypothetical protein